MTTATDTFLTYANAKNDRDLETAMNVWHPDAVLQIAPVQLTFKGRDQAQAFFAEFLDAIDSYHGEIINLGTDGGTVIADWTLHGEFAGPLLGLEPTGAQLELPILSLAEIRDGAFTAETLRFDLATLARQAQLPINQLLDLLNLQHEPPPVPQGPTSQPRDLRLPHKPDTADDDTRAPAPAHQRAYADAEEFLSVFTAGWRSPQPLEQFLAHFLPHVDPDVRLHQPLGTEYGHEGFHRVFRRLFTLMPDIHGEVREAFPRPDGLLVLLEMRGTLGRTTYSWTLADRITLRNGRLIQRQAYFDPLPLFAAVARRPSAWPRALRSLLRVS